MNQGTHQKLGESPGIDPSLLFSEGAWSCQHPGLQLPASRTGRESMPIVQATQSVVLCVKAVKGGGRWLRQL